MTIHGWISLSTFFILCSLGISTGDIQRIQISRAIEVKANKDTPAYQAFRLLKGQRDGHQDSTLEAPCAECKVIEIMASEVSDKQGSRGSGSDFRIGKMIWLAETKIDRRDFLPAKNEIEEPMLAHASGHRRILASLGKDDEKSHFQLKDLVLEDSSEKTSLESKKSSGISVFQEANQKKVDFASTADSKKNTLPDLNFKERNFIEGDIELAGGLAITDQMHIMIGRVEEGQYQDYGSVDLKAGNYKIKVQNLSGIIVGKLMDDSDHVVGEGYYRLSELNAAAQVVSPKLTIYPPHTVAGNSGTWYNKPSGRSVKDPIFAGNLASGFQEVSYEAEFARNTKAIKAQGTTGQTMAGEKVKNFRVENVHPSSFALLRTKTENFFQTNQIVSANETSRNTLYPISMVDSLKQIIAEQRQSDELYDRMGRVRAEDLTVIWGQVVLDDQPVTGISVELERFPEIQAIYFNPLLIPDPNLKATGPNGYFAFLGSPEGLHALLAKKGYSYFSHANVFVETGAVALADMKTSTRLEPVSMKIFDAFSGAPQLARVTMQSLTDFLDVTDGSEKFYLPLINRMSLAQVQPDAKYMPAIYSYNDQDSYLHLPLISSQWLAEASAVIQQKSGQTLNPLMGTIVGFVPDEEFEIEIYGYTAPMKTQIIYFDHEGKITEDQKGLQGGGFIIPNYSQETVQIAVRGLKSGKTYLRIMPVDAQMITVITARQENR